MHREARHLLNGEPGLEVLAWMLWNGPVIMFRAKTRVSQVACPPAEAALVLTA